MVAFETSNGTRYRWYGDVLVRLHGEVMEYRTDVQSVDRIGVGLRAVVVTTDGRVRLTSRVTWCTTDIIEAIPA